MLISFDFYMFFDQKKSCSQKTRQNKTKLHNKWVDVGGGCNECFDVKKYLRGGVIYSGHECYLLNVTAGLEIKNRFNETKNFLNFKRLKRQQMLKPGLSKKPPYSKSREKNLTASDVFVSCYS